MKLDPARLDDALKAGRIRVHRPNKRRGYCALHSPGSMSVNAGEGRSISVDGHPAGMACSQCAMFVILSLPQPRGTV